jgi:predicted XRE-type DNA-binding protein
MEEQKFSSEGLQWLYDKYIKDDSEAVELFKEYEVKADIAKQVYDLRTAAGLTQAQLADLVGVEEPEIDLLEQADYEGDSLAMLVRIASVVHRKVEVRLVPDPLSAEGAA